MSTPSIIAVARPDGAYDTISCNWDGYPEDNGRLLLEHWTDPAKLEDLIKLGDISSLGEEIGERFNMNNFVERQARSTWCHAYVRDCGEEGNEPRKARSWRGLRAVARNRGATFIYIRADGRWLFSSSRRGDDLDRSYSEPVELTAGFIEAWLAAQEAVA